jgi:hypothetical protein
MKRATRRAKQKNSEADQVYCLINSAGGHLWMCNFFDDLPPAVRGRLRSSRFNLCPACLQVEVLPKLRAQHPEYSREKALFAAIAVMEAEVDTAQ